jgi:hypothetical protein
MGNEEAFDAAYLMALMDCENYAARIPPSQTLGYVPTDLYRKSVFAEVYTGTAGVGFVMTGNDMWTTSAWSPGSMLPQPGGGPSGTSCAGSYSDAAYPNNYFPPYGARGTGVFSFELSEVSDSFKSTAGLGTEYIQVASLTSLSCVMVPGAAADSAFVGRATVYYSSDPERASLYSQTWASLEAIALEQDSALTRRVFNITRDGLFASTDREDGTVELQPRISICNVPLENDCFEWRRIGAQVLFDPGNVTPGAAVGILIEAPTGTKFEARETFLWQTEQYPSNQVFQFENAFSQLHGAVANAAAYLSSYRPSMVPKQPRLHPMLLASDPVDPRFVKQKRLQAGRTLKTPKSAKKPLGTSTKGPEKPPSALSKFRPHALKHLGSPIHPVAALASVIADRSEMPGFHNQLAQAASATPAALGNFMPTAGVEGALCKLLCGPSGGPAAVEQIEEPSFWQKLLSGAADVGKFVAPLLPLLF